MKKTILLLRKSAQVFRDGFHASSSYWQNYKIQLPPLPSNVWSVVVGMALGDAGISKKNKGDAAMKIEQGWKQHSFSLHLFSILAPWCFITEIGTRIEPVSSSRHGIVKSYWFRTFGLPQLTTLWNLLYVDGEKRVPAGFVLEHVDACALAYLIICDGSTSGSTVIIHTQGFSEESNNILSKELNLRYGLNSSVISHKKTMKVIKIPSSDAALLRFIIEPHMIPSMQYKIPLIFKSF